jgi:hypothetical protein
MTAAETRAELLRLLGGTEVCVSGSVVYRVIEVFHGATRLRRMVGLVGTEKEALTFVLDQLRRARGLERTQSPWCYACPKRRGVQRHRAVRDGLCALHIARRDRARREASARASS